ncbi:hypothetical protein [Chitinophaga japonensis]|uniref:hypothetical protein n=1 Tax=Chitinophaga japonensis TaxID=104662 RepID=UPI0011A1FB33|nr:hypothetical protein [Chitinophaga japonensis]
MKKAKVMLTVIAVFAVVGGALAFKARTQHTFYRTNPANGQCSVPVQLFSTTTSTGGQLTQLSVASTTDPCPTIRITAAQ